MQIRRMTIVAHRTTNLASRPARSLLASVAVASVLGAVPAAQATPTAAAAPPAGAKFTGGAVGRNSSWSRLALASLVVGSVWLPAQAKAAPQPLTVVATGEVYCGDMWNEFDKPLCGSRVELTAVEGVGGSAVLTRDPGVALTGGPDKARTVIDFSCMSFGVTDGHSEIVDGVVPYTLWASGTADDGTTYRFFAEDRGVFAWDRLEIRGPGDGACGTSPRWANWLEDPVVVTQ